MGNHLILSGKETDMRKVIVVIVSMLITGNAIAHSKPVYLYFAAVANYQELSDPDRIRYNLDKAVEIGVTDVIVGVKHVSGEVLYKSKYAPQITEWWGFERSADYDFLNIFIREAHTRGLKVHASLNVFAEGQISLQRGRVYTDKPHWQTIHYSELDLIPITEEKSHYTAMVNPALDEIREHQMQLILEIVTKYDVDGIVLDRVQYSGIEADFSSLSLSMFSEYIGWEKVTMPEEIFMWARDRDGKNIPDERELFQLWLEWRASVMYEFIAEARGLVKQAQPGITFGIFTGSWYPTYYEAGLNWGSSRYDPSKEYHWATPGYKNYGIAELLDVAFMNCYFFEVTAEDVEEFNTYAEDNPELGLPQHKEWYSVEGAIEMSKHAIQGATTVIASLHIHQYRDDTTQLERAIESALRYSDGVMLFDVIHLREYDFWELVENSIQKSSNNK
jgi:hypothetical protein